MSLWDFVAAASITTNIKDPTSKSAKILKKINSASLLVLNGDALEYVGGGGRTYNTFGASSTFTCDFEAVLDGFLGGYALFQSKPMHTILGLVFGPGAVNNMTIGNITDLQYMPIHSRNFTFRRGGTPEEFCYGGKDGTSGIVILVVLLVVLGVLGFYLIYNFAGAFGKGIMSPVGEFGYINAQEKEVHSKEKEIHGLEASEAQQKKEQQQRADAGYVLSPAEQEARNAELEHTEEQLAAAEHQVEELERTLKTAERQKEWLIFGNVILENRGIWLVKYAEKAQGALVQAKNAVKAASEKLQDSKAFVMVNMNKCEGEIASLWADQDNYSDQIWWAQEMVLLEKRSDNLNAHLEASERELASATKKLADLETALEPAAAH
ncbi:MAG: hypothetical protein NTV55_07795 [Planctomycetota bacterium]|nr:hypothetical protein [Planctomycetota bacterium]